jgi:hypothetical protein
MENIKPKQKKGSGKHWKPLIEVPIFYQERGRKKKGMKKKGSFNKEMVHNYY